MRTPYSYSSAGFTGKRARARLPPRSPRGGVPRQLVDELGHHADPPMTKDAVAGRIRRLLAMADKRASDLGVAGTEANLPADLDEA